MSLVLLDKPAENVHFPLRSNVEFSVGFVQFTIEELTKSKVKNNCFLKLTHF